MKNIELYQVKQLLQLIQTKPEQHIVHFTDGSHLLTKHLSAFYKETESHYNLYCTKKSFYDKSMTKYKNETHMHIMYVALSSLNDLMNTPQFDTLIVTLDLEKEDKISFLKKCYTMVKKEGEMIIFIPNSDDPVHSRWKDSLAEQHYVSSMIHDDLFDDYDVIIAKK